MLGGQQHTCIHGSRAEQLQVKTSVVEDHNPITGTEGGKQVQKREAALPRLTTKPDLDLYNLGFMA